MQKGTLEKEFQRQEHLAEEKDNLLQKKLGLIGNYVHDSVPMSNNEVT